MTNIKSIVTPMMMLLPLSILSACATTTAIDVQRAKAYCAPNGGLTTMTKPYGKTVKVQCANTAKFTFQSNEAT